MIKEEHREIALDILQPDRDKELDRELFGVWFQTGAILSSSSFSYLLNEAERLAGGIAAHEDRILTLAQKEFVNDIRALAKEWKNTAKSLKDPFYDRPGFYTLPGTEERGQQDTYFYCSDALNSLLNKYTT